MIPLAAVTDAVHRIDPVVPPVGDRRPRDRRQAPFPDLPEEPDSKKDESELDEAPTLPRYEPDPERKIDIHVLGLLLPTRQFLPTEPRARRLH